MCFRDKKKVEMLHDIRPDGSLTNNRRTTSQDTIFFEGRGKKGKKNDGCVGRPADNGCKRRNRYIAIGKNDFGKAQKNPTHDCAAATRKPHKDWMRPDTIY